MGIAFIDYIKFIIELLKEDVKEMATMTNFVPDERRIFERFTFKEDVLLLSDKFVGIVRQISLGGIFFQYMERGQLLPESDLELVASFGRFSVKASDYTVLPKAKQIQGEQMRVANCSIRMANMGEIKMREFSSFIRNNCQKNLSTYGTRKTSHTPRQRGSAMVDDYLFPRQRGAKECCYIATR